MHFVVTLGHNSPALAVAEICLQHGHRVSFISRAHHPSDLNSLAHPQAHFYPLLTWKFHRHRALASLFTLPIFCLSLFRALKLLSTLKPDVIIAFGSHVAVPICLAAFLLRRPYVIHEQTHNFGLGNRLLKPFASLVAASYPLPGAFVTGPLLRPVFGASSLPCPSWFKPSPLPLLYVTGGSQGSQVLNQLVFANLASLTSRYQIIHQYGLNNQLPHHYHQFAHYFPRPTLTASEVAYVLRYAKLCVSRAGANTLAEIMFAGLPTLFIPLPTSANQEQLTNAQALVDQGAGLLLPEDRLSSQTFIQSLSKLQAHLSQYRHRARTLSPTVSLLNVERFYAKIVHISKN